MEDIQAWCNGLDMVMCIGVSCWLDRLMENGVNLLLGHIDGVVFTGSV